MSLPLKLLFCIAAFFVYVQTAAQQSCTCEAGEKLKPGIIYYADNNLIDSAFYLYNQIKNFKGAGCLLLFYHGTAQLYMQQNDLLHAYNALQAAERIVTRTTCEFDIVSKHYNIYGRYYLLSNQLDSAARAYLQAVEAGEKSNNSYVLARAYEDLASVLSRTGDFSTSNNYHHKAIVLTKNTSDPRLLTILAVSLSNLSAGYMSTYEKTGNPSVLDSAGKAAIQANTAAMTAKDLKSLLESFHVLSRYHYYLKNYKLSSNYCDSIIMNHIPGFTNYNTHLAYQTKAEAAWKQQETIIAASFADSSQKYAALFNPQQEIISLELIYKLNKELNNTNKSLHAYERMILLKNSVLSLEKNKIITELEKKYSQARNEKTIKELSQQRLIYALLGIGGLLIAGLVAFYFRQQSMKHKQKIMETEQRLNRARMNPHFFFNALTALQSYAVRENDKKELVNNISRFSHIMRETLESTYKEYITIEQEIDFLTEYMQVQKIRLAKQFSYSITAAEDVDTNELFIPSMIVQPFLENSIEHGFKDIDYDGVVTVRFSKKADEAVIHISDNGTGFPTKAKESEHISRAGQIIKDRIYLLNIKLKTKARFSIENNKNGQGIFVEICLPLLYKEQLKL